MKWIFLAIVLGCGSRGDDPPRPPPAPAPADAAPASETLAVTPFETRVLATSPEPLFAAGTLRKVATIRTGVTLWGTADPPARVIVSVDHRYELLDAKTGTKLADLDEPIGELGPGELHVRRGNLEHVVRTGDGAAIVPAPRLPMAEQITALRIVSAADQAWLLATAGDQTYAGPWNDRAPAPVLADVVPAPTTGFATRRLTDGLELGFGLERGLFPCVLLRLRVGHEPDCVGGATYRPTLGATGSWNVELASALDHPRLVAIDTASTTRQTAELPCERATIVATSPRVPRVVVACRTGARVAPRHSMLLAWTPGHVRRLDLDPDTAVGRATRDRFDTRVISVASLQTYEHPTGELWLDLDAGTALRGPRLEDLTRATGGQFVAFDDARRAVVVDAGALAVRAATAPCDGDLAGAIPSPRFTIVSCRRDDTIRWSKVIDLETHRVYAVPGVAEAVFSDATVLASDRNRTTDRRVTLSLLALE